MHTGTGGENICFDPLGTHTRAFITDMRPKLFDGEWKENVGGGDFVQMFGSDGKLQYWKELDPQLHVSGPCFSNAEYTAVTLDDAVSSHVTISGSRTDDLVRSSWISGLRPLETPLSHASFSSSSARRPIRTVRHTNALLGGGTARQQRICRAIALQERDRRFGATALYTQPMAPTCPFVRE